MQLSLFKKPKLTHGGTTRLGKAKCRRPLSTSRCLHAVMRVSPGDGSFLKPNRQAVIQEKINRWSAHFGVKIYARSVNSNHIHMLVFSESRTNLQNFFRVLPGQIAQSLRSSPGKFWEHLAFTRVVNWGSDFERVRNYIERNTFGAAGLLSYRERRA